MQYRWPKDRRDEILVTPAPQQELDYTADGKLSGRILVTRKFRISLSVPVRVAQATDEEWNLSTEARTWPALKTTPHSECCLAHM
jgi:hypothetical protein